MQADQDNVVRGVQLWQRFFLFFLFSVGEGREGHNRGWRANISPTMNAGLVAF